MDTTDKVLRLIVRYIGARNIAGSTLCRLAVGNSTVWSRLRSGRVTVRTLIRLVQYLSDHWPPGLDWLEDIPRPEPSVSAGDPKDAA